MRAHSLGMIVSLLVACGGEGFTGGSTEGTGESGNGGSTNGGSTNGGSTNGGSTNGGSTSGGTAAGGSSAGVGGADGGTTSGGAGGTAGASTGGDTSGGTGGAVCTPKAEACNGVDDSCDGAVDEGQSFELTPLADAVTTDIVFISDYLFSAYAADAGVFGVLWSPTAFGPATLPPVRLFRLDAEGKRLPGYTDIKLGARHPSIASNGTEFGVTWAEELNADAPQSVHFAVYNAANGQQVGATTTVATDGINGYRNMGISVAWAKGSWYVSHRTFTAGPPGDATNGRIRIAKISSKGVVVDRPPLTGGFASDAKLASYGDTLGVVWAAWTTGDTTAPSQDWFSYGKTVAELADPARWTSLDSAGTAVQYSIAASASGFTVAPDTATRPFRRFALTGGKLCENDWADNAFAWMGQIASGPAGTLAEARLACAGSPTSCDIGAMVIGDDCRPGDRQTLWSGGVQQTSYILAPVVGATRAMVISNIASGKLQISTATSGFCQP